MTSRANWAWWITSGVAKTSVRWMHALGGARVLTVDAERDSLAAQRHLHRRFEEVKRPVRNGHNISRHGRRVLELGNLPFLLRAGNELPDVLGYVAVGCIGLLRDGGHVAQVGRAFAGHHGDSECGFQERLVPAGEAATRSGSLFEV